MRSHYVRAVDPFIGPANYYSQPQRCTSLPSLLCSLSKGLPASTVQGETTYGHMAIWPVLLRLALVCFVCGVSYASISSFFSANCACVFACVHMQLSRCALIVAVSVDCAVAHSRDSSVCLAGSCSAHPPTHACMHTACTNSRKYVPLTGSNAHAHATVQVDL